MRRVSASSSRRSRNRWPTVITGTMAEIGFWLAAPSRHPGAAGLNPRRLAGRGSATGGMAALLRPSDMEARADGLSCQLASFGSLAALRTVRTIQRPWRSRRRSASAGRRAWPWRAARSRPDARRRASPNRRASSGRATGASWPPSWRSQASTLTIWARVTTGPVYRACSSSASTASSPAISCPRARSLEARDGGPRPLPRSSAGRRPGHPCPTQP